MRKILYISMMFPHDKVAHAGGKILNYYLNRFAEDEQTEVTLIAKLLPEDKKYIDSLNKKIILYSVETPENELKKIFFYSKSINSKINPFYPLGNVLSKGIFDAFEYCIKNLKNSGYEPDLIVLEWTWIMLWIDTVKKYFPYAKYIGTEHDVSYLGLQRKYQKEKNILKKYIKKIRYRTVKKFELKAAQKCDYVNTLNEKDRKILLEDGIPDAKVGVLAPYFDKPAEKINRHPKKGNVLYYGAMGRPENYLSVLWFIEKVMPLLDKNIKFTIMGGNPPCDLKKLESDRIEITGFVDDTKPYFERSMCLVAPLQLGAGIKIKILEAFAMGVPVLTNSIGIEGIDAINGRHYLHCESADDYAVKIRELLDEIIDGEEISKRAIMFIENEYDFDKSYNHFSSLIDEMIRESKRA